MKKSKGILVTLILVLALAPIMVKSQVVNDGLPDFYTLKVVNGIPESIDMKVVTVKPFDEEVSEEYNLYSWENKELLCLIGTYYLRIRIGYSWEPNCQYFKSERFEIKVSDLSRDIFGQISLKQTVITLKRTGNGQGKLYPISKEEYDR